MRRIVTAVTAAAMALSLVSMAMPAAAMTADLPLGPPVVLTDESAVASDNSAQSTSTVFFQNTGTDSSAALVNLAVGSCIPKSTYNVTWEMKSSLGPPTIATYSGYFGKNFDEGVDTFTASASAATRSTFTKHDTYQLNGALVLASAGAATTRAITTLTVTSSRDQILGFAPTMSRKLDAHTAPTSSPAYNAVALVGNCYSIVTAASPPLTATTKMVVYDAHATDLAPNGHLVLRSPWDVNDFASTSPHALLE